MSKKAEDVNKDQAAVIDATAKTNPKVIELGMKLGKAFLLAAKTQRVETLKCAESLKASSEDDVNNFLKGFRETLSSSGLSSAAQQSSKVKAVILAYRVEEYKQPSKLDEVTKEVTFVTKSGKEHLEAHQGTFESLCTLARAIRGPQTGQGAGGGKPTGGKVTEAQMESIEEKLSVATGNQALEIMARAADQIVAINRGSWEPLVIEQLVSLTKRLSTSDNLIFQKLAGEVEGVLNDYQNMREQMSKEMIAAKNVLAPSFPTPANVGQPFGFTDTEPAQKTGTNG